jgi:hypothetical protein
MSHNNQEGHEHDYQLVGRDTICRTEYYGKPVFPLFQNVVIYSCECGAEFTVSSIIAHVLVQHITSLPQIILELNKSCGRY